VSVVENDPDRWYEVTLSRNESVCGWPMVRCAREGANEGAKAYTNEGQGC
jgi:hypothetical protein